MLGSSQPEGTGTAAMRGMSVKRVMSCMVRLYVVSKYSDMSESCWQISKGDEESGVGRDEDFA